MGAAERVSRRSVLRSATEAVEKTNDVIERYNDCVAAVKELGLDLTTETRERNADVTLLQAQINIRANVQADDKKFAVSVDRRCDHLEANLSGVAGRVNDLFGRSFFGRLKFVVLGR